MLVDQDPDGLVPPGMTATKLPPISSNAGDPAVPPHGSGLRKLTLIVPLAPGARFASDDGCEVGASLLVLVEFASQMDGKLTLESVTLPVLVIVSCAL